MSKIQDELISFGLPDYNAPLVKGHVTRTALNLTDAILSISDEEDPNTPCFWRSLRSIRMVGILMTLDQLGYALDAVKMRSNDADEEKCCKLSLIDCSLVEGYNLMDYRRGNGKELAIPSFTDFSLKELENLINELEDAWDHLMDVDRIDGPFRKK